MLLTKGLEREDISNYVSAYAKNKLVIAIFEQTLIPSHVINAPMHQDALNTLATIMITSRSDMARVNAANAILVHTKPPESSKLQIDMNVSSSVIDDYQEAMHMMVKKQKELIALGGDITEIVNAPIKAIKEDAVDAEIVD